MGPNETSKLLHSKGNHKQDEKTTLRMEENICKAPFLWLGCLWILSCMSCLYILEINPLSVASFASMFSHSVGCLFILFMVSFAVQKLLSFIRSHLFIFAFISISLGGGSERILLWFMSLHFSYEWRWVSFVWAILIILFFSVNTLILIFTHFPVHFGGSWISLQSMCGDWFTKRKHDLLVAGAFLQVALLPFFTLF